MAASLLADDQKLPEGFRFAMATATVPKRIMEYAKGDATKSTRTGGNRAA